MKPIGFPKEDSRGEPVKTAVFSGIETVIQINILPSPASKQGHLLIAGKAHKGQPNKQNAEIPELEWRIILTNLCFGFQKF